MYRDPQSSSGSGASTKDDEVEIVSRFLAPLCAKDEAARNIALEVARSTVEGWLGGVGSPNHWDDTGETEDCENVTGMFKCQDGRYDMSVERSPTKSAPKSVQSRHLHEHQQQQQQQLLLQDTFRTERFFPQSVTENPAAFLDDTGLDSGERYSSGSFDCVDGRLVNETTNYGTPKERRRYDGTDNRSGHSTSSDEGGKSLMIEQLSGRCLRLKDGAGGEARFGSSSESERKYLISSSNERLNESSQDERTIPRTKSYVKVKGAKQKQLEDDELDSDTRIYGKSPKFDDNLSSVFDRRNVNFRSKPGDHHAHSYERRYYGSNDEVSIEELESNERPRDRVVFNTLDGFENDNDATCHDDDSHHRNNNHHHHHRHHQNYYHRQTASPPPPPPPTGHQHYRQHHRRPRQLEDANLIGLVEPHLRDEEIDDALLANARTQEPGQDCLLRKGEERKFSAGQIKRPLSQDDDVSSKSGRVLESPEVTPGDVGRLLNLGNALDGPRQTQANKYLSLVTLHLPVILRLSVNCPFQNVRIKCAEILEMVKDRGLPVPVPAFDGPSAFVPTCESSPPFSTRACSSSARLHASFRHHSSSRSNARRPRVLLASSAGPVRPSSTTRGRAEPTCASDRSRRLLLGRPDRPSPLGFVPRRRGGTLTCRGYSGRRFDFLEPRHRTRRRRVGCRRHGEEDAKEKNVEENCRKESNRFTQLEREISTSFDVEEAGEKFHRERRGETKLGKEESSGSRRRQARKALMTL